MLEKMTRIIEANETYVGGRPRIKGSTKHLTPSTKQPVVVLVQRDGTAFCKHIDSPTAKTLRTELLARVDTSAILMTDEHKSYIKVGREFAEHHRVKHKREGYVRRLSSGLLAHTNTAESFFALKRGRYGVYHSMSARHLHRYCSEFGFRWCHRKVTDEERTTAAIQQAEGKRFLYQTPCSGQEI